MVTQSELQFLDVSLSIDQIEYECFLFPLDSMPTYFDYSISQTSSSHRRYASLSFHCGNFVDIDLDMHHESDNDGSFVLPIELSTDIFGETNEDKIYSLPLMDATENHFFDRGKSSCKF